MKEYYTWVRLAREMSLMDATLLIVVSAMIGKPAFICIMKDLNRNRILLSISVYLGDN